jgi:transposase
MSGRPSARAREDARNIDLEPEEVPDMTIVVGMDLHREQITYDLLDMNTGEVGRGRVSAAHRNGLRRFLSGLGDGEVEVAVEATTGWRFVVEEVLTAGMTPRLAEPAETKALRGRKRRAKTDRADAHHLRVLLAEGRLPEAWIAPESILELRAKVRLRKALMDERTAWQQRIHSLSFHPGNETRPRRRKRKPSQQRRAP